MNPLQRLRDWLLERRIASLSRQMINALSNESIVSSNCFDAYYTYVRLCNEHAELIAQRSPSQLARMKGRGE